jgi:hypothetical protein
MASSGRTTAVLAFHGRSGAGGRESLSAGVLTATVTTIASFTGDGRIHRNRV